MFTVKQKSIDSFLDGALVHNEPMGKHSRWNVGGRHNVISPQWVKPRWCN